MINIKTGSEDPRCSNFVHTGFSNHLWYFQFRKVKRKYFLSLQLNSSVPTQEKAIHIKLLLLGNSYLFQVKPIYFNASSAKQSRT